MVEPPEMSKETLMRARRTAAILVATVALVLGAAAPAFASESIDSFTTTSSTTQAGGHPDLETSFTLDSPGAPESARNVIFNTPEGMFGNPNAVTQCTLSDFALDQCPSNSQVGLVTIHANYNGNSNFLLGTAPLFGMVPQADETARFSFIVPTLNISIAVPVAVRTGSDYGLRFTVAGITQLAPLAGANLTFWGFPADPSHDAQHFAKGTPGNPTGCAGLADTSCIGSPTPASIPNNPLTDNPTTCSGQPLVATLDVQTYKDPRPLSHAESSYPPVTDCEKVTFNPVVHAKPTTTETDSASGLDLELSSSQFEGFSASPSQIRSATVTLPPGFTINPDAADGQSACTDVLANFGSEAAANCPDNSKIGTFSLHTVALAGPLTGSLYFGKPQPDDQYRLFMVADGFGIHAKLEGSIHPDPLTGQLTATFNDLPQVPFDDFQVHLFASDRGLMATPTQCTLYSVDSDFFPWDAALPDQHSPDSFTMDSGPNGAQCPGERRPFNPRLVAGTSNPNAGAFSSFTLKLDRDDGDQFLGDLNFTMPPGFTGSLRGISYCPEASIQRAARTPGLTEQAIPSCPAPSQIGTSNVAAGPGSHPFHAIGKIYMAGPFKGAPLSIVAVTPALAGPYDYGTVVVRVAVHIDPLDAHVIAVSDTVPSIIGGVPIRMRSIQVNLDKPSFIINPTSCDPFSIASQGIGDQSTVADFSSYFHAANCLSLGFAPKMTVRQLGGRKATKRNSDPSLQFDLTTRPGDANVKSVALTLPSTFEIDQRHLRNFCTEKELLTTQCAGRQAIGEATTTTPLLDQPLSGRVYAVSGSGGLPHLAFLLHGQVDLVPRAESKTIAGGRLRTTVPVVPDAPIGHFHLVLFGGKHGYLANTRDICRNTPLIRVAFASHSGKTLTQSVKTKTACGGSKGAKVKHHRRN
jgi:hypothetical protein